MLNCCVTKICTQPFLKNSLKGVFFKHYLLHVINYCNWKNWFSLSTTVLVPILLKTYHYPKFLYFYFWPNTLYLWKRLNYEWQKRKPKIIHHLFLIIFRCYLLVSVYCIFATQIYTFTKFIRNYSLRTQRKPTRNQEAYTDVGSL